MAIAKTRHFHTLMLLFFMGIFVISCSVSDTETDTFSDVKSTTYANYNTVDTILDVDTTSANINDLESSSRSANGNSRKSIWTTTLTETLYYDTVTDNDWRNNPLLKSSSSYKELANWIFLKANKINVNYTNHDGDKMFLNFTFFTHRKDVWYQVVSENRGIVQTGWSTVQLFGQSLQYYSPSYPSSPTTGWFVKFDVQFHPETLLDKNNIFAVFYNNTFAKNEHRGQITNVVPAPYEFKLANKGNLTHPGNFGYRNGHVVGKTFMPKVNITPKFVSVVDPNKDWRKQVLKYASQNVVNKFFTDFLFNKKTTKSFHYTTTKEGGQYWMNLTFDPSTKDVEYRIVSQKIGTIQQGKTGIIATEVNYDNLSNLYLDFDVDFDSATLLPNEITLAMFKARNQHRGVILPKGHRDPVFSPKDGAYAYSTKVYKDEFHKTGLVRNRVLNDWRENVGATVKDGMVTEDSVVEFMFRQNGYRRAHIATTPNLGKIWLTIAFSPYHPCTQYYISSERYGKLQYGHSSVSVYQPKGTSVVFFTMDVNFDPQTGLNVNDTTFAIFQPRHSSSFRGAMKQRNDLIPNVGDGKFAYLEGGY